jgi:hypothetical protein
VGLIINRTQKWAFIHIPKTGGNSISKILLSVPGSEQIMVHGTLNQLMDVGGYFIFSFVRNPFTRLASWYEHKKREGNIQLFSLTNIETNEEFIFDSLVDGANYLIGNGFAKGKPRNVRMSISNSLRGKKLNNGKNNNGSITSLTG